MTGAKLQSPILLIHGLLGFDRIRLAGLTLANYFPLIPQALAKAGNRVLIPSLSPTHGIEERAAELKVFVDRHSPAEPVHLIAHSMGGLDARYMISRLDMAERVLSLTTVGTPHRGSCLADWATQRLGRLAKPLFNAWDIPMRGFYDLTRARCLQLDQEMPDSPRVRYFSVVGTPSRNFLNPELLLSYHMVWPEEGPNDGVVSEASANYGESMDVWDADHMSLINWRSPVYFGGAPDLSANFCRLVGRLADEGF